MIENSENLKNERSSNIGGKEAIKIVETYRHSIELFSKVVPIDSPDEDDWKKSSRISILFH